MDYPALFQAMFAIALSFVLMGIAKLMVSKVKKHEIEMAKKAARQFIALLHKSPSRDDRQYRVSRMIDALDDAARISAEIHLEYVFRYSSYADHGLAWEIQSLLTLEVSLRCADGRWVKQEKNKNRYFLTQLYNNPAYLNEALTPSTEIPDA